MALAQLHQSHAAAECSKEQHFHFQWSTSYVPGAINHEGAVRNEQHRCALETWVKNEIEQQLQTTLHLRTSTEIRVSTSLDVDPAKNRPPQACIH